MATADTPIRFQCAEIDPSEVCQGCFNELGVRWAGPYEGEWLCEECSVGNGASAESRADAHYDAWVR